MSLRKLKWWGSHRVAPGSHDVRGWWVVDADGTVLGTIEDLLFEADPAHVRYVGVQIAGEKVLLPITDLTLEADRRVARVQGPWPRPGGGADLGGRQGG